MTEISNIQIRPPNLLSSSLSPILKDRHLDTLASSQIIRNILIRESCDRLHGKMHLKIVGGQTGSN